MKPSKKINFSSTQEKSKVKDCQLASQIDTVVDQVPTNPLKAFFQKDQSMSIKTMESLNENQYYYINHKAVSRKKQKKRDSKMSTDSGKSQNGLNEGINSSIKGSEKSLSQYINSLNQQIMESKDHKERLNKREKKKFSSLKLNMDQLITIKQVNVFDQYHMEELLGEGAFGQVFRARCKQTNQERAIKVIKGNAMSQKKTKQFLAQTSLLKGISHPSIIKVYSLYHFQKSFYVVMEYCRGGDLNDLTKIKNKSEKVIANIMRQVLGALTYLHSLDIIHRDIKIDNIVFLNPATEESIKGEMPIKIIDFGTAVKMKYKFEHQNSIAGTISYMAPEAFKGILTQKSDIWSCGILMLKLLTGVNPFSGQTEKQTRFNIRNKPVNLTEKLYNRLSDQARDILSKMLQKNVHKRASAKQLLKHPWFKQCIIASSHAQNIIELKGYEEKDNLVQVIECYLTLHKVNQEEREKLAKMFNQLDKDCSGHIEKTQFIQLFKLHSKLTSEEQLENMINTIDKDKSGKIDFNQFMVAMSNKEKLFIQQSLSQAFEYFDKDHTGFIQKAELEEMLKNCPNTQIQYYLSYLDKDKDNKISRDEFIQYLTLE